MRTFIRFFIHSTGLGLVMLATGCGGGGGGSLAPSPASGGFAGYSTNYNSAVASYFSTGVKEQGEPLVANLNSYQEFQNLSEYDASSTVHPNVLTNVHKAYSYQPSLSGNGKTIAVVDTGFNSIQEFDGKRAFAEMQSKFDAGKIIDGGLFATQLLRNAADGLAVTPDQQENWHGTAVASIAAAPLHGTGSSYYTDMQATYPAAAPFYSYTGDRPELVHGMMGVAYAATLFLTDVRTHTNLLVGLANATTDAANAGAVVQNNSWGLLNTPVPNDIPADIGSYTSQQAADYLASAAGFTAAEWLGYYNALRTFQSRGVVVFALENDSNSSSLMAALPQIYPNLQSAWVTVGNIETAGATPTITRQSAPCGDTAPYCLVADGTDITGANLTNNLPYRSGLEGTSFAAPQVSGMIAILAEAFPSLSPADLVTRLLATANNSFFTPSNQRQFTASISHGYNSEFGHGIPDLYAALQPITSGSRPVGFVFMGSPTTGVLRPMAGTGLQASPLMLGALQAGLRHRSAFVYDALGAGFQVPLTAFFQTPRERPFLGQWLKEPSLSVARLEDRSLFYTSDKTQSVRPWSLASQFSLAEFLEHHSEPAFRSPGQHAAELFIEKFGPGFVHSPMQLSTGLQVSASSRVYAYLGESRQPAARLALPSADKPNVVGVALSLDLHHTENRSSQVLFGIQKENNAVRGTHGQGAMRLGSHSQSIYVAPMFRFRHENGWQLTASASLGLTEAKGSSYSLITGASSVVSSELRLQASRPDVFDDGDLLSLDAWQPETVESGYINLRLPALVGPDATVRFTPERVDLSRQPRTFIFSLAYQRALAADTTLRHEIFVLPRYTEHGSLRSSLGFALKVQRAF